MKYCVSGRQPRSVIKRADQVRLTYQDKDRLIDYIEEFPDKTYILMIPRAINELPWDLLKMYSEKVDFILGLENLSLVDKCKENNLKFYYPMTITNWYDLDSIIKLEPCYIVISGDLFFNLKKVKNKTNIPLRVFPNYCSNDSMIMRENGVYGTWIRPEDISAYEEYISAIDFAADSISKEETYLDVYKQGKWNGNLNVLFINFGKHVDNRAIPEELGKTRMNCGRRCMESSMCRFCETGIKFSNSVRAKHYKDKKITLIEEN